ncbi:MAG: hypothetical protein V2I66_00280, partial [Halieaceae bacterium]|nr:hypothetical protein [Halieaceae bacterium]
ATRELFERSTGSVFDPVAAAEASARLTLDVLLNPERAARMNRMATQAQPGFVDVLQALLDRTWLSESITTRGPRAVLERAVNDQVLAGLMTLAQAPEATMHVRAQAIWALEMIAAGIEIRRGQNVADWRAHYQAAERLIEQVLDAPLPEEWQAPKPPPGSPIGLE